MTAAAPADAVAVPAGQRLRIVAQGEEIRVRRLAQVHFGQRAEHARRQAGARGLVDDQRPGIGQPLDHQRAAAKRGICTEDTCAQIIALLRQYGLPTETDFTCDALTDAARSDKKIADGKLHLIVPERIGHCRIEAIPAADIRAWLADGGIA